MRHPRAVQGILNAAMTRLDDSGRHGTDKGIEHLGADRVYHALSNLLGVQAGGGPAVGQCRRIVRLNLGGLCGGLALPHRKLGSLQLFAAEKTAASGSFPQILRPAFLGWSRKCALRSSMYR